MKYIKITKHNAQQAADALGISEYIKACHRSYFESDCPLLLLNEGIVDCICDRSCSLYNKAFGKNCANAGSEICPMYRISNMIRGEEDVQLSIREDVFCCLECEDI